jgi:transposase InsO family protein
VTEFICRYGVPVQIHTDQGSQFTSALFQEMCHKFS